MFLLFSRVLEIFLLRKTFLHFLCIMVFRYAWIHNFHYAHTFGCKKCFHDGLILSQTFVLVLPSTPCSFCWFFSKPLRPNVFFQGVLPLFMFITFFLLFQSYFTTYILLCFLKFIFSTSTANMLFYQLRLMVLRLRLGCKKKLVVLRWPNSNLDGAVLKIFWCQI